jgi:hypothetical protein
MDEHIEIEDLTAAFEAGFQAAMKSAAEAASRAFAETLKRRMRNRRLTGRTRSALDRYAYGSWKHTVLETILRHVEQTGDPEFRFSDLNEYERDIHRRHQTLESTMNGVNVTLQGLVKDSVLANPERGLYRVI